MGATAISSVMRSVSMDESTCSRSNRRWSRTVAPAAAAASRFSNPRMCEGGVATPKRSVVPEAERAAPVRSGVADGAVGVAHRLGPVGRTRAEHQHGVVVGTRVTWVVGRAASRSAAALERRLVDVHHRTGAEAAGEQRRPRPRPPRPRTGAVSDSALSTSSAFQAGLSRTAEAPSLLIALTATTNSGRFAVITATRSPCPTPSAASLDASAPAAASSSRNVQASCPANRAG